VSPRAWTLGGLLALALAGTVGFLAYPTFPNYDSYYALLWGREIMHLQLPSFGVYRAPTEHPLAIAFGALLSVFGRGADRIMVAATIASFVALAAGLYRLSRLAFTPLVGVVAVALLCTRFEFPFLAARGYLDIPYLAMIVWAAALETQRPRRGTVVFIVLAAAGLLRPEAWLMTGLYFLWCAGPATWGQRARFAALAALAPLLWAGVDLAVTGDPLYSLHSTSDLADELGRSQGLASVPTALGGFLVRLDKIPVLVGAGVGAALAIWLTPRRVVMPLVLLFIGIATFALVGAAGLSVIDRYLLPASVMMMVLCAVGLAGWSMLEAGWLRCIWAIAAVALVAFGVANAAGTLSLTSFETQLSFRRDSHASLQAIFANPRVRADMRCGPISVPNHKLIPDVRWVLGRGPSEVLARNQAVVLARRGRPRLKHRLSHGVALYPTGSAIFQQAIVETSDDPIIQIPPNGFDRIANSQYYAAYARC